jgi:hypothetical protein
MKKIFVLIFLLVFGTSYAGTIATSGITANTIISRAQVYLDSADDPFFNTTDYVQWIDEAVKETANRTSCLEASPSTVALVANQYRYALATSFLKVVAVEHNNGDDTDNKQIMSLARTNINDIGHNNSSGRPQIYTIWNDKLVIWPIPRAEEAGTYLYIYYVTAPVGVSATSSQIETPSYFDTAILYYVVAMGNMKNGAIDKGKSFLDLYEKRIAEYNALVLQHKPLE